MKSSPVGAAVRPYNPRRLALTPGTRLGVYEVTAPLGEGGMGQVFRAHDTKLNRDVALKILPDAFASDPDRLARFTREAQTLASLNHPNIAHIHGLEESNGVRALVMELVEGEDLSQRITRGPIPLEEALPIAKQIADALEAAHEQGIIHRDLKPANIKVRPDGTVKVLDFGLAKMIAPAEAGALADTEGPGFSPANSPTITTPAMTEAGMILGTVAYMSPEQARGKPVDKRTDIWAFGCVLYEMLTAKRAFEGQDVTDTLAAVVRAEPKWDALPTLPAPLEMFLKQCFKKDARQRLGDIREIRLALEGAFDSPVSEARRPVPARRWKERAAWAAALVALLAWVVTERVTMPSVRAPEPTRLSLVPNARVAGLGFAMAPDGRSVAYSGEPEAGGVSRLWVRRLDDAEPRQLAGTEGAFYPFWSPDNASIGFFAGGYLKRIAVGGGAVQTLCESGARPVGGSWGRQDVIIFADGSRIRQVPASGGAPALVRAPTPSLGETALRWVAFLPDGRRYLYTSLTREGTATISLASIDSAVPARQLVESLPFEVRAEYAEPGVLLYLDRSFLLVAQPVDPVTLTPTRSPAPLSSESVATPGGWAAFSVSEGGALMFQTFRQSGEDRNRLLWMNRQGRVVGQLGQTGPVWTLALSRDQSRVVANLDNDIWLYDVGVGIPTRMTAHPAVDYGPKWAPDGRRFAFTSTRNGTADVFVKELGKAGEGERLVPSDGAPVSVLDWSRDGKSLILSRAGATSQDIWAYSFANGQSRPILQSRFNEPHGKLSPDGRWLAYASDEPGQENIYVTSFPDPGPVVRVSPSGGAQPRWRGDSQELYYLAPDRTVMAAAVSATGTFLSGQPVPLFRTNISVFSSDGDRYDVSPDGQRFLVIELGGVEAFSVLLDWMAELGRSSHAR